jgi:hypothetical protein
VFLKKTHSKVEGGKTSVDPQLWISNQARGPAEFKHIIKRRKRN